MISLINLCVVPVESVFTQPVRHEVTYECALAHHVERAWGLKTVLAPVL